MEKALRLAKVVHEECDGWGELVTQDPIRVPGLPFLVAACDWEEGMASTRPRFQYRNKVKSAALSDVAVWVRTRAE